MKRGSKRNLTRYANTRLRRRAARAISHASAALYASGFSHNTWSAREALPRRRALRRRWRARC